MAVRSLIALTITQRPTENIPCRVGLSTFQKLELFLSPRISMSQFLEMSALYTSRLRSPRWLPNLSVINSFSVRFNKQTIRPSQRTFLTKASTRLLHNNLNSPPPWVIAAAWIVYRSPFNSTISLPPKKVIWILTKIKYNFKLKTIYNSRKAHLWGRWQGSLSSLGSKSPTERLLKGISILKSRTIFSKGREFWIKTSNKHNFNKLYLSLQLNFNSYHIRIRCLIYSW